MRVMFIGCLVFIVVALAYFILLGVGHR